MTVKVSEGQSKIVVERVPGHLQDRFRSYRILVDDVERAELARGETVDIEGTPSTHVVEARIDSMKSGKEQLTLDVGETKVYTVRPSRRGGALRTLTSQPGGG